VPQLEAFYSIFTTEQQDHVKSVEYLRSNFRPIQSLDDRHVFKSAVKDAWQPDLMDGGGGYSNPYGTEASKGKRLILNVFIALVNPRILLFLFFLKGWGPFGSQKFVLNICVIFYLYFSIGCSSILICICFFSKRCD